jgi:hypothetical protein
MVFFGREPCVVRLEGTVKRHILYWIRPATWSWPWRKLSTTNLTKDNYTLHLTGPFTTPHMSPPIARLPHNREQESKNRRDKTNEKNPQWSHVMTTKEFPVPQVRYAAHIAHSICLSYFAKNLPLLFRRVACLCYSVEPAFLISLYGLCIPEPAHTHNP